MDPSPFAVVSVSRGDGVASDEETAAACCTCRELHDRYVSEAKALASGHHQQDLARGGGGVEGTSRPWSASARQIGITYGLGVGLYLRILVW